MEEDEVHVKRESTFPLFSKYFSIQPQNVVDYISTMKKQMEDFIEAFKKRIEVEINYSKSLTQVSKSLDKYIKPGTELASSFISSAFKVEHQQRSRQAMQLAEALKTEVESMCSQMLKKETTFYKKMEKDVKKYYKEASTVGDSHREALFKFEGISKEMEEMIITKNIMKYTTGMPQEKKVKLISKAMDSIRENKQYQKLYIQSVKSFNLFAKAYNEQITQHLNQAENQVRDQITMQCDCLRKLIVAEVSMFKNIEYDLLNISKQMEYLDTQKEVQIFVDEHKNDTIHRLFPEEKSEEDNKKMVSSIDTSIEYVIQTKKLLGKSMLSNSLLHVDEEYFSWMLFNKKNKQLRDIISGIWKMLKQERQPKKKEQNLTQKNLKENNLKEEMKQEEKIQEKNPVEEAKQTQEKISENGQQKKEEPISEQKTIEVQKQNQIQDEGKLISTQKVHNWPKQLELLLQTFKIQQPPNLISSDPSKEKEKNTPGSSHLFEAFMNIMKIIASLWNIDDLSSDFMSEQLSSLEKYMLDQHLYRLIAFIFLEEYRIQLEVMIKNINCVKSCSQILKVILCASQRQNDTFIIRGILGLIFTYYWIDDKYKKLMYLNPDVYQCEIWKKHDFWEAAIFQTTYEEMAMFAKQKGETQAETMLREKNIIFSQLASFCHYMVMFGITSKNVRLIVGRYCRLYEMTEEQNKDLSKMITNTTKQFKEFSFQFSLKGSEKEKSVINE